MENDGKIHVYYGQGKGKTTAAVGQAVRALGAGLKVLVFQFLKDNVSSERTVLEKLPGVTCIPGRDKAKFYWEMSETERMEIKNYNKMMLDELIKLCDSFDVLFLDEILCAVSLKVLDEDILLDFLRNKPRGLEVILTGHEVSGKVLEIASYATEMKKRKHPFDAGLEARLGIEY